MDAPTPPLSLTALIIAGLSAVVSALSWLLCLFIKGGIDAVREKIKQHDTKLVEIDKHLKNTDFNLEQLAGRAVTSSTLSDEIERALNRVEKRADERMDEHMAQCERQKDAINGALKEIRVAIEMRDEKAQLHRDAMQRELSTIAVQMAAAGFQRAGQ